jgi:hypothetical protein
MNLTGLPAGCASLLLHRLTAMAAMTKRLAIVWIEFEVRSQSAWHDVIDVRRGGRASSLLALYAERVAVQEPSAEALPRCRAIEALVGVVLTLCA